MKTRLLSVAAPLCIGVWCRGMRPSSSYLPPREAYPGNINWETGGRLGAALQTPGSQTEEAVGKPGRYQSGAIGEG